MKSLQILDLRLFSNILGVYQMKRLLLFFYHKIYSSAKRNIAQNLKTLIFEALSVSGNNLKQTKLNNDHPSEKAI